MDTEEILMISAVSVTGLAIFFVFCKVLKRRKCCRRKLNLADIEEMEELTPKEILVATGMENK
jgi:hypothetical protein